MTQEEYFKELVNDKDRLAEYLSTVFDFLSTLIGIEEFLGEEDVLAKKKLIRSLAVKMGQYTANFRDLNEDDDPNNIIDLESILAVSYTHLRAHET